MFFFTSMVSSNRLAVPPGQVNNRRQPGFPGCRPTDLERPVGRHDICRLKTYEIVASDFV